MEGGFDHVTNVSFVRHVDIVIDRCSERAREIRSADGRRWFNLCWRGPNYWVLRDSAPRCAPDGHHVCGPKGVSPRI